MTPRVSVIVLSHRSEFAPIAMASVHAQTYPNVELILKQHKDYWPEKFNEAARAASGKYVMFLPDDDTLEPRCIAAHVEAAERETACMVYSDFYVTGPLKLKWHFPPWSAESLQRFCVPYMTFLIRLDVFRAMGGWDSQQDYMDRDMGIRLWERNAKVVHLANEFLWNRLHHRASGSVAIDATVNTSAIAKLAAKHPTYNFD